MRRLLFWLAWPGLYLYFAGSERSRVIVRYNHEVLLVQGWWRNLFADESWGLPGGGIERRETSAAGACRELKEELGLVIEPSQLTPLGSQMVAESGLRYRAQFFLLELTAPPELIMSTEIQQVRWVRSLAMPGKLRLKADARQARQLLADR